MKFTLLLNVFFTDEKMLFNNISKVCKKTKQFVKFSEICITP